MENLSAMGWIVLILDLIVAIALGVVVLMQTGKQSGLSSGIAGGADTHYGKIKGKTIDGVLSKITSVLAVAFLILSIIFYMVVNKGFMA